MRKNPLSFKGRIRRAEYFVSCVAYLFVYYFIWGMGEGRGGGPLAMILVVPMLWFAIAQGTKRMHDVNKSGWWQLVPLYNLWLLFQPGMAGNNQYGGDPKVEPYQGVDDAYDKPYNYRRPEDPS
ncbi:DUF805 domain-containing protein [Mucilaginibacter pedocola]|uniref:DUF805 domain-containing protein n=1 Tax=Mucilaginibacter pedocola TaxID=1792845 RepID=A0A1S9P9H5_9SPHI|nr:DUF805 domain-containing protein [Mucilaginibacter pedocola]OOQ57238.1 hypothetical protein BC343_14060 [Mucilaginibacter pedocola]